MATFNNYDTTINISTIILDDCVGDGNVFVVAVWEDSLWQHEDGGSRGIGGGSVSNGILPFLGNHVWQGINVSLMSEISVIK